MTDSERAGRPTCFTTRPLPWVAAAVVAGALAGLDAARGGVGLVAPVLATAVLLGRRASPWLVLVLGLSFAHGWAAAPAQPRRVARDGPALERARDEPVEGRWRPLGRGRGWLEPVGPVAAGHSLLYELDAPAPADGERVTILPGGELVPWPAGPVAGPRRTRGRLRGVASVAADELVRHGSLERHGAGVAALLGRARGALLARAERLEPHGRAHGLVAALVAGERGGLSPELLDLFTRTGTRHLLALSGLHVGLLTLALLMPVTALLLRLPRPRPARLRRALVLGVRLAALATYACVVGLGAPVTRASVAAALVLAAPSLPAASRARGDRGRVIDPLSVWSFALLLEGVSDPQGLPTPSLALSYTATLGILLGTRPISSWLRRGARGVPLEHAFLPPWRRALLAMVRRGGRVAAGAAAASASAVLATLPLAWRFFGEVSPVGVVATTLALAPLTGLLVVAWAGVLVPPVPVGALGDLVAHLAGCLVALLEVADGVPGSPWPLPPRPFALVAALVALSFAALAARGRRVDRLGRVALAGWGVLLLPWSAAPAGLELHALDVGHGSAFVLRAPGLPALVFDAGSRDRPEIHEEALAPLLGAWEVRRPWVALSHDHVDHRSALPRLAARHPPPFWLGAPPEGVRLAAAATAIDPTVGRTAIGVRGGVLGLAWIRGTNGPGNEGSRSLEIAWRAERILLTGDAEAEGLARALAEGWMRGPVRLLAFPHHGSHTPLLNDLLDRLRPAEVWISAAHGPPVGRELERRQLAWRWTGRDGPLALFLP